MASATPTGSRTALVTGGSSGLGLAIVLHLAREGYTVVATSRAIATLEKAFFDVDPALRERVRFAACDLATIEGPKICVDQALELLGGRLDVLVNNAGAGFLGQFIAAPDFDAGKFDYTMALDVRAPMMLTSMCTPALEKVAGCVVNISSIAASRPLSGAAGYCMAKAAVEMLTKVSALELAPKRIRVNCVAPATVETHFHESAGMSAETAALYYKASTATHPIGRVGVPDDIASLVVFLADPSKAGFITGSVMLADGGRLLTSATAAQLAMATAEK